MPTTRRLILAGGVALASGAAPLVAAAASRRELTADGLRALHKLEDTEPRARRLAARARAVLVFPQIIKAGFVFGGETGDGVLLIHGAPDRFYNISGGSWGLQIGGQTFGLAIFFMTDSALRYLRQSAGFSIGTGPSIVVVGAGAGAQADTTTLTQDAYAMPFNQKGLMADLTLQGNKITRIHPD